MIIAIANHKGGTGKTTTAVNVAAGLAQQGSRVLLIDLDPQANLGYSFGILETTHDTVSWMLGQSRFSDTIHERGNLAILPCSVNYYEKEEQLRRICSNGPYALREALRAVIHAYDFVVIDCPPSFSLLTANALLAADAVLIPTLFEVLSIVGIEQVLGFIESVRLTYNHPLEVLGVLGVNVDERRQLTYEVLAYIRNHYNIHVFNNYIRANVKAAEAPSFAKPVIEYAPSSNSARDYLAFINELGQFASPSPITAL